MPVAPDPPPKAEPAAKAIQPLDPSLRTICPLQPARDPVVMADRAIGAYGCATAKQMGAVRSYDAREQSLNQQLGAR